MSVSREPRRQKRRLVGERDRDTSSRPRAVGTPPAATTISLPADVRALSTATIRDQPPVAVAFTSTIGAPNTSSGPRPAVTAIR